MYESMIEAMKAWPDWVWVPICFGGFIAFVSIGTRVLGIDKDRKRREKEAADEPKDK